MPTSAYPFASGAPAATKPLIVRLRNWVGDVVLTVPALRLLQQQGYALHLIGKPWAASLLAGEGWTVHALPAKHLDRVRQLHALHQQCRAASAQFDHRLNAIVFPFSFSSALAMRLAGLRAVGHASEGRSFLLSRALPRIHGRHELEVYWEVACSLLERPDLPAPAAINLAVSPEHQAQAGQLLAQRGLQAGRYVVLCPFAGGTFRKMPKTWPGFAELARNLGARGLRLVLCPGPGAEQAHAEQEFAGCTVLPGVKLGVYAGLLQQAALMISNDTGPGHMAAAVGTPTLSVLGPTDPAQWRPWGPQVVLVQGQAGGWPSQQAVMEQVQHMLPATLKELA